MVTCANGPHHLAYDVALRTHRDYATRYGHQYYLARETVMESTWNKIPFLASIISTEIFKPPEDRLEWLL